MLNREPSSLARFNLPAKRISQASFKDGAVAAFGSCAHRDFARRMLQAKD